MVRRVCIDITLGNCRNGGHYSIARDEVKFEGECLRRGNLRNVSNGTLTLHNGSRFKTMIDRYY